MNSKIASRVRRRLLVAGAGALSFPVLSLALSAPNTVMKGAALRAQTPGQLVEGLAIESGEGHAHSAHVWGGERLVLSGRLTGPNGEAIARAVIGLSSLTKSGMTALTDADGRFMFVTTAPAEDHLDLQVTTPSGQVSQRVVPLSGQTCASDHKDSFAAIGSDEGSDEGSDAGSHAGRHANQRVWRSGFSLSVTT